MSKELTEQLRNGTLEDGLYYALTSTFRFNEEAVIERAINGVLYINNGIVDFNVKEVLAKVPSYEQDKLKDNNINDLLWKLELSVQTEVNLTKKVDELATKCSRLEEQLEEAEKVIKFYANADQLTDEEKQMPAEKYHLVYGLKANDYLETWGSK